METETNTPESLIVISKVKKFIKEKADMNTSAAFFEPLNQDTCSLCKLQNGLMITYLNKENINKSNYGSGDLLGMEKLTFGILFLKNIAIFL